MRRKLQSIFSCLNKLMAFLISVWVLSLAVFFLARLTPADPLRAYYGERAEKMSVEEKERAREKLGLNDPIHVQYVRWVDHAIRGDFGISYKYRQNVTEVIRQRIGNTMLLGGLGLLLTFAGALGLGILCAWYENRWPDRILCKLGTLVSCIPEFWLSLMLVFLFSVILHWLPAGGAYTVGGTRSPADFAMHLILPLTAVVSGHLWYYAYMVRNRLLEEMRAGYVLPARAKGLSRGQVLVRHCLRNSLPSYISLMAISVPHVLGGTYVVETVFSYPGIGALAYESARLADYNLLMVLCLLTGVTVMLCSMAGRIVSERMDPRVRGRERFRASEGEL